MDGSSRNLVEIANSEISIYKVLFDVGVDAYGFYGNTSKIHCPFGAFSHFDGGQERAMRVYEDTNSAYCFACSKYFNPVILWSEFSDLSLEESAEFLLEGTGWKPETFEVRWERMVKEESYDVSRLPEALDVYCETLDPEWEINRIEEPYISVYSKLMQILSYVKNPSDAEAWLETAKKQMRKAFEK